MSSASLDRAAWQRALASTQHALSDGQDGAQIAAALADLVGDALAHLTLPPRTALLGLGGLARREMAPHADVDVMVLVGDDAPASAADDAARALTPLWDAGLRVASSTHAVSALDGLLVDLRGKAGHAATSLLDARPLGGDLALGRAALRRFRRELLPPRRDALVDAKLAERARRLEKHASAFENEPDLKEGAGGLRDLHTLIWVGLASCGESALDDGGDSLTGLLRVGWLREREVAGLRVARAALLRVRAGLHLGAGRREERLFAENAARAASALYGSARVEDGERAAREVVAASARVAQIVEDALRRAQKRFAHQSPPVQLGAGFFAVGRALHLAEDHDATTATLILAEGLAAEHDLYLDDALVSRRERALEAAAGAPAADDVDDKAVAAAVRMLADTPMRGARAPGPFSALLATRVAQRAMADLDRLALRVTHDGIHALTTGAHLCVCADLALALVSRATPAPRALEPCLLRVTRPHLVVLAALLHDIGKGREGDHSVVGEALSEEFARWLELEHDDAITLAFLVREHLLLSRTAQRRDLADPAVIDELAAAANSPERLDLLALLTWVDMQAVGPGVATEWKAQLLRTAVDRCRDRLLQPAQTRVLDDDVRAQAHAALTGAPPDVVERFVRGASARFLAARSPEELALDVAVFERFVRAPICEVRVREDGVNDVRVVAADRAGLLASVAAGLASEGVSILDATLDTRSDGLAFDVFLVDDGHGRALDEQAAARVPFAVADAIERSTRASRRGAPRARVEPRVRTLHHDSWGRPVLEVRTADRVGLLAELAQVVSDHGLSIALARIHTEGARVTDVFTLEKPDRTAPEPAELERLERALADALAQPGAR